MATATPFKIQLSAATTPGAIHADGLTQRSADKASELLMTNHSSYHTLYNEAGLHNHIVHHLLSIYALGATPEQIQKAYDLNKNYQIPAIVHPPQVAIELRDPARFKEHLGDNEFYGDYLKFFQEEISEKGIPAVVNEYVFKGDDRADDILLRMYSGFLHPILHLGFALEFNQPCLVAEALASAAIHDDWPIHALLPAEELARKNKPASSITLVSLAEEMHSDPVVSTAVRFRDAPNKIVSGVYRRAKNEVIDIISKYTVAPGDLERKTAEMIHFCVWLSGVTQNPKKVEMFDFFLMHSTNLSIFYPTFLKQDWISTTAKCRLLEWKTRMDLIMYAACRTPSFYQHRVTNYSPKAPGDWKSIYARACEYKDDGHASKIIRAVKNAEIVSKPYQGQPGFLLHQDDFLRIAHMVMDSVERMDEPGYKVAEKPSKLYRMAGVDEEVIRIIVRWVRWCGIEEVWDYVPDLSKVEAAKL